MKPEEHLRSLQDPDRWSEVRLPRAVRAESVAPLRVARFVPTVVALVIAVLAVAGIGVGFASIPHGAAPAETGTTPATGASTAPSSSATPVAGACDASNVDVELGQSASLQDYLLETLTVEHSGAPCALPAGAFTISGIRVGNGWGVTDGAVMVPKGESQLYLQVARADDAVVRLHPSPSAEPSLVTLRIGDRVRTLGSVAFSGSWASPVLGQVDGGRVQPIGQLAASAALAAAEAALQVRYDAASASASASAAATPSTSTPSATPSPTAGGPSGATTSPAAAAACASAQLSFSQGDFGGGVGVWLESLAVQNDGAPCTVTAGQFTIGAFTLGEANRYGGRSILLGRDRTTLAIAAAHSCSDQVHANIPDQADRVPIVLHAAGSTRVIGDYPRPVCFAPYFF